MGSVLIGSDDLIKGTPFCAKTERYSPIRPAPPWLYPPPSLFLINNRGLEASTGRSAHLLRKASPLARLIQIAFSISALVIFTPLFLPLVQAMGIDLIHFGLVVAVNLTIGMCTPPLGVCLFVSGSIAKVSLKQQMRDLVPMLGVLLVVLAVITYLPWTVTFLPNLFG